jgi:hypothetical protein
MGGQPLTLTKAFSLVAPATSVKQSFAGNGAYSFSLLDAGNTILVTYQGSAVVTGAFITCTAQLSNGGSWTTVDGSWAVNGNQLVTNSYMPSAGGTGSVTWTK